MLGLEHFGQLVKTGVSLNSCVYFDSSFLLNNFLSLSFMRNLLWQITRSRFTNISIQSNKITEKSSFGGLSHKATYIQCSLVKLLLRTVELHLSGLTGTTKHYDKQKIRILGFFKKDRLLWQFEVGNNAYK